MAESAGAHASSRELSGSRRTTSYWVDGKDGKLPWSDRRVAWLVAVPLMAMLIGIATTWAVFHIQDVLEDEAKRDLVAAGIDPRGLTFDFEYRTGTGTGTLPAGVTAAEAEAAVDDGLLRELTILAESGAGVAVPAPELAEEPAGSAAGAIDTGPTEATAQLIDGTLVLTGVVLSEGHRTSLVEAAIAAVGADSVRDELTVSGLAAAVDGADDRIGAMADVLGTLGGAESATVALTDASLDVTATAAGVESALAMESAAAAAPVAGAIAIHVAQGPTEVDVRLRRGVVVLRGTVLSEAQRTQLVDAAASLVGAGNVDDRLEVTGLAEAAPGADDRIAALAGLIGELDGATAARGRLTDSALTLNAATRGAAAAQSIVAAGASITATAATVTANARAASLDTQIAALQAELDGLAAEIRETVVFETGEAELTGAAQATLDKVAAAIDTFPRPAIEVSGHTDDVGAVGDNQTLSADRAAAVVGYLTSAGVDGSRLRSRGAGETEPIADNGTSEGRARNRRVEFTARESF